MKSEVLLTGMVSAQLSSFGQASLSDEFKTNVEDWSKACRAVLSAANADMRHNAIGQHTVANQWLIEKDMTNQLWSGLVASELMVNEFIVSLKNPQSVLFADGVSGRASQLLMAPASVFNGFSGVEIGFVNDASLFMFEENLKNKHEQTSFGYSVYDKSEILENTDGQFDMIFVSANSVLFDLGFVSALIENLNQGGMLVVGSSNDSSQIYSGAYKWHPYTELHSCLSASDGTVLHLPHFYGMTIFTKN